MQEIFWNGDYSIRSSEIDSTLYLFRWDKKKKDWYLADQMHVKELADWWVGRYELENAPYK